LRRFRVVAYSLLEPDQVYVEALDDSRFVRQIPGYFCHEEE